MKSIPLMREAGKWKYIDRTKILQSMLSEQKNIIHFWQCFFQSLISNNKCAYILHDISTVYTCYSTIISTIVLYISYIGVAQLRQFQFQQSRLLHFLASMLLYVILASCTMRIYEWCFRPWLCTVRLYWAGETLDYVL